LKIVSSHAIHVGVLVINAAMRSARSGSVAMAT